MKLDRNQKLLINETDMLTSNTFVLSKSVSVDIRKIFVNSAVLGVRVAAAEQEQDLGIISGQGSAIQPVPNPTPFIWNRHAPDVDLNVPGLGRDIKVAFEGVE